MGRKKKVLFFLNSGTGGAERVTVAIAKMLPEEEFDVIFIIAGKSKGTISKFIPNQFHKVYILFKNIWLGIWFKFYKVLKRERPYAIFCSTSAFSVRLLTAAKLIGGIKTIIRSPSYFSLLRKDERIYCRLTFKYANVIIAQQEDMRKDILRNVKLPSEKVIVLQNPIDREFIKIMTESVTPFEEKRAIKYLCVGRFNYVKGQDVLTKAFVFVARQNPKAHLYFVGKYADDTFFHEIEKTVKEGGCDERVHFVGYDANPYRWMKYCDCFVLPSRIEGLPNSLIEAQYLGRPAVATTCIPIISEIVEDGVTGYTVPPEDPAAMADAMLKAPTLGTIESTYHSANDEDFIKLFE